VVVVLMSTMIISPITTSTTFTTTDY
jgi:hypothetical protein